MADADAGGWGCEPMNDELAEFFQFSKKIIFFLLPILGWLLLVVVIDPFNYWNISNFIPAKIKDQTIQPINQQLYKSIQYKRNLAPNIIIGDSRSAAISSAYFAELTGKKYFNLGTNACKINEIIDFFYFADRLAKLEEVVIVLNFSMYNKFAYADRVKSVLSALDNPLQYIFSRSTAQASWILFSNTFLGTHYMETKPGKSKEKFWQQIMRTNGVNWYERYEYPAGLYKDLRQLAAYCQTKGIRLTMVVLPHHIEFQRNVVKYNLGQAMERFYQDMCTIGSVVDYDYPNEITESKENFNDPVHMKGVIGQRVVRELVSRKFEIGIDRCASGAAR